MPLTQDQISKLRTPNKGRSSEGLPEDDSALEAYITEPYTPPTPKPPVDPLAQSSLKRADVLALTKELFPTEAAEFTDDEIAHYAAHYLDGSAADTLRMIGKHMRDRLAKRVNGKPMRDDSKGLAELENE